MFGFVYHDEYNKYDLGLLHPLIGEKPKRTLEYLTKCNVMKEIDLFTPPLASEKDLLRVHNPRYVERVKTLSKKGGMLASDTPAPKGIYSIARRPTGGTLLGGQKLFENYTCMMNPLAGFHHASSSFSSGFCFFNDIAVVIEYLRETYNLKRFLVIDLDVHHANGTQEIYYDDPSVLLISFHQDGRTLYPGTGALEKIGRDSGEGYTVNFPFQPGTGNTSYWKAFERIVPPLTLAFDPELIIYQSGVDTHHSDPLADLQLTYPMYYHLASSIQSLSQKTCQKLLVCFGGGYDSHASVLSSYNIVCGLLNKTKYISERSIEDDQIDYVESQLEKIQRLLQTHWSF